MSRLPRAQSAIVQDGRPTQSMYDWMRSVDVTGAIQPAPAPPAPPAVSVTVQGRWSVQSLQSSETTLLQLRGDVPLPPAWTFYGRAAGDRQFVPLTDGFANGTAITKNVTDGVTQFDFTGDTDDVPEGSSLYFTAERAIGAISAGPMGHLFLTAGGTTTVVAVDTPVIANVTTDLDPLSALFDSPATNRLRYTGTPTLRMVATATFAVSSATANQDLSVYVAKNGAVISASRAIAKTTTGNDTRSGTAVCIVELATNDYLEVWLGNNSGAVDIDVSDLNLICKL